ncbi:hypothetical protein A3Q56_06228 [Intoshia linei]|uniref:A-kinase anchor protein 7-like phosphoesterase domain-containing protein n=1 Tax=Intoshia linei TaxID=1819745 RepID=A0A177AVL3_9BILA|nr:hypothetical protein A3Q56_06228 [Intoshia linei]
MKDVYFFCIKVDNVKVQSSLTAVGDIFLKEYPEYTDSKIESFKYHVTFFIVVIYNETELTELKKCFATFQENIKQGNIKIDMTDLKFDALGHFRRSGVLYAKPSERSVEKLSIVRDKLLKYFTENGMEKYLQHQDDDNFVPHLSLIRMALSVKKRGKKALKFEMYEDIPFHDCVDANYNEIYFCKSHTYDPDENFYETVDFVRF